MNVFRKRKTGRPSGGWEKEKVISNLNIMETSRRNNVQHASQPVQSEGSFSSPATSSKADPQKVPGTNSRPKPYLLDKLDSTFRYAKLPKNKAVLSTFLFHMEEKKQDPVEAAQGTLSKLKDVWEHHFGMRLVHGFDSHLQESTKKMIIEDAIVRNKITSLWKQWKELERTSRRPDRASKSSFSKYLGAHF